MLRLSGEEVQSLSESEWAAFSSEVKAFNGLERRRILHLAYERAHEREILRGLASHRKYRGLFDQPQRPPAQVFFCLDEREESMRRALEEASPSIETYSAAGYFGVAVDYNGIDDPHGAAFCPVVIKPQHAIVEQPKAGNTELLESRLWRRRMLGLVTRSSLVSYLAIATAVFVAIRALAENSPRRLLAFLALSQSACILSGLESPTAEGITGALVHWVVVTVSTVVLFGILRLLEVRFGENLSASRHLGLAEHAPRLAVSFAILGLALVGLPGTLGFCSQDLLIHGTLTTHPLIGLLLPIATAMNAVSFFRLFTRLFLGKRRTGFTIVADALPRERWVLAGTVLFVVSGGLFPNATVIEHSSGIDVVDQASLAFDNMNRGKGYSNNNWSTEGPPLDLSAAPGGRRSGATADGRRSMTNDRFRGPCAFSSESNRSHSEQEAAEVSPERRGGKLQPLIGRESVECIRGP